MPSHLTSAHADDSSAVADAQTPLILNCWYVAARSHELTGGLLDRWLLGRSVLLYRASDGMPVALDNRCPHRSFPLSKGRREGDSVSCGYHGMTFDRTGRCVRIPAGTGGRANLGVRCFPVLERAPLVWIWMGDPRLADSSAPPDYFPLRTPGWASVDGYFDVAANYVGLHENLQDLSHFEHLRRSSIGVPDQSAATLHLDVGMEAINTTLVYSDVPAPPMWARILPLAGQRITRTIREAFKSPALCDAHTTITDMALPPGSARDFDTRIYHFITPESQYRTHYWWFFLRNFAVESVEVDDVLLAGVSGAFEEDKQALEWISELTQRDGRRDFREVSFRTDKGGVMMRRRLCRWAENAVLNAEGGPTPMPAGPGESNNG